MWKKKMHGWVLLSAPYSKPKSQRSVLHVPYTSQSQVYYCNNKQKAYTSVGNNAIRLLLFPLCAAAQSANTEHWPVQNTNCMQCPNNRCSKAYLQKVGAVWWFHGRAEAEAGSPCQQTVPAFRGRSGTGWSSRTVRVDRGLSRSWWGGGPSGCRPRGCAAPPRQQVSRCIAHSKFHGMLHKVTVSTRCIAHSNSLKVHCTQQQFQGMLHKVTVSTWRTAHSNSLKVHCTQWHFQGALHSFMMYYT